MHFRQCLPALRAAARSTLFLLLLLALAPAGCGSGGGSGARCDPDTFTPNYVRELSRTLNWPAFPVTVYFVRNDEYSAARREIALAGFDQWGAASDGRISYREVAEAAEADVIVRFDPTTANGLTTSHFRGSELTLAEVLLGVRNQLPSDLQCVAAHEFGHALGIDGHSDNPNDLMYFQHFVGELCPVTTRDLNTLKTGYCFLYGRCAAPPSPGRAAPTETITIQ